MNFGGRKFETCEGREQVYGRYEGANSTVTATAGHGHVPRRRRGSVNTYFVQLELATGMCRVTKMAKKLGVKLGTREPRDLVDYYQHIPSFTLGTVEVSPLSMAEAYATFAARGIHCNPMIVSKITDRAGKNLDMPDANCQRVMGKDVADGVNKVLKSVMDQGHRHAGPDLGDGRQQAGKTGTIDSNEAVWFAGYTPEIAGVAMISIDNTRKPFIKSRKLPKRRLVPRPRRQGLSGPVDQLLPGGLRQRRRRPEDLEAGDGEVPEDGAETSFKSPPRRIERRQAGPVPSLFGLGIRAATEKLEKAGFNVETQLRLQRLRAVRRFSAGRRSPGRRSPQFGTIYRRVLAG